MTEKSSVLFASAIAGAGVGISIAIAKRIKTHVANKKADAQRKIKHDLELDAIRLTGSVINERLVRGDLVDAYPSHISLAYYAELDNQRTILNLQ